MYNLTIEKNEDLVILNDYLSANITGTKAFLCHLQDMVDQNASTELDRIVLKHVIRQNSRIVKVFENLLAQTNNIINYMETNN